MRRSVLDDYLYGEEPEEPIGGETLLPTSDDEIKQSPVSSLSLGNPELSQPKRDVSDYANVGDDSNWKPNWLAGLAAFTRDPTLIDMAKRKQEEPQRKLQLQMAQEDRSRRAAAEQREQEKFNLQKPYFGAQAQSQSAYAAESQQRLKKAKDLEDPNSPVSMAASDAVSRSLLSTSESLKDKNPSTSKIFADAAQAIRGKSAAEVRQYVDSRLGDAGKMAMDEYQKSIQNELAQDASARGWANIRQGEESLGLQKQEAEDKRQKEYDFQIGRPQEKLNKDINDLEIGLRQMNELGQLKGKVNTGPLVGGLRNLFKLNKFDEFTSAKRAEMLALGARLFNKETKQLAGAAVSPSEWARIEPQIPVESDDDDVYMTKLKKAIEATNMILSERRKEYQQKEGRAVDKSFLAKEQVGKMQASQPQPEQAKSAPQGSKPGQTFRSKSTGDIFEVQPDMTLKKVR